MVPERIENKGSESRTARLYLRITNVTLKSPRKALQRGGVKGDASVMVIEVRSLARSYENIHPLRGLSIDIARGGIVGLLGPSGAGSASPHCTIPSC